MTKPYFKIVFQGFFLLVFISKANAQWPIFEDVTDALNIVDTPVSSYIYGNGAAIADYDKDGDLDFFLCAETGLPDRLYSNSSGLFTDIASTVGIGNLERTRTALWLDFDSDQDLDLLTLGDCYGEGCNDPVTIFLYEQLSNGTFTEVSRTVGLELFDKYDTELDIAAGGLAAADMNGDGFLDIIISVWGGAITYFENDGNGNFIDKSIESLIGPDFQFRWQPILYDFNEDGMTDIFCNVDFVENELWINNGNGTFSDIAGAVNADSAFNEMGVTIADYDNDGDMDIYATNISRIDNNMLRHNILLQNNKSQTGNLEFTELANPLQIGASGWDWGTTFFDVNNDGMQDLATTNGWTPNNWSIDPSKLWLNLGDGLFGDISSSSQFNDMYDATTLLAFDMDRDGDLDLLQTLKENTDDTPLKLYENKLNTTSEPGNFVVIKPRMNSGGNHFSIGAIVRVTIGEMTQMQLITAGTSFYGQEPAEAYFGLGNATVIEEVLVKWPDGTTTLVENVDINQTHTITNDIVLKTDEFEVSDTQLYPNPASSQLFIKSEMSIERIIIRDLLGKKILTRALNYQPYQVDVSDLNLGFYMIQIVYEDGSKSPYFKILKN